MPEPGPVNRTLATVAGGALLLAGGVAVFVSDNGPGTLALITVGALFGIVGLTGLSPTKLKLGDNEIILEKVKDAQDAYGRGDDEKAEQIVEDLVRPPSERLALSGAALDRARYEDAVLRVVERGLPEGWTVTKDVRGSGYRFDALLTKAGAKDVVVEIFATDRFTGDQLLRSVGAYARRAQPVGGVLAVATADASGVARLKGGFTDIAAEVLVWRPSDEERVLAEALGRVLAAAGAEPPQAAPSPPRRAARRARP